MPLMMKGTHKGRINFVEEPKQGPLSFLGSSFSSPTPNQRMWDLGVGGVRDPPPLFYSRESSAEGTS